MSPIEIAENCDIKICCTPNKLKQIAKFRYSVYVGEQQREIAADHLNECLFDTMDDSAHNFYAEHDNEIIGTIRVNLCKDGPVEYYDKLYGIENFSRAAVVTRFMVSRPYRKTSLTIKLCKEAFDYGRANGISTCYMDCRENHVKLFEMLGFIRKKEIDHPEFGLATAMILDLNNLDYLQKINSPFILTKK